MGNSSTPQPPATAPTFSVESTNIKGVLEDLLKVLILNTGVLGNFVEKAAVEPEKTAKASKWFADNLTKIITSVETPILNDIEPLIGALVKIVTTVFEPMANALGEAAQTYVDVVAKGLDLQSPDSINRSAGTGQMAAGAFFDQIMKPIVGVISKADPTKEGAGLQNIQSTLGALVAIHMMTWIVDIVGDVSGIGWLKFFRSFNRGMLRALDIRSLAQVAMGVYQEVFMATPARYDLYQKFPIKYPSETEDIKLWIRGVKSNEEVQAILAKLGYAPALQTQFLTTTQQYLDDASLSNLWNSGFMKQEDVRATLKLKGWADASIDLALFNIQHQRIFAIIQTVQQRLEAMYVSAKISEDEYKQILKNLFFSDLEIEWLIGAGQIQINSNKKEKKLSRSDLAKAYGLGIISEDQAISYLEGLGYNADDANLIMQIEFYSKEELKQKQQLIAARMRVQAEAEAVAAAAELKKNQDAEAAAKLALSNLEKQFASSLGG